MTPDFNLFKTVIVFLMAVIPAFVWLYLFFHKKHSNKILTVLTFIGGMVAAKLILVYQGYWDQTVNLVFFKVDPVNFKQNIHQLLLGRPILALFLSFIGVGVMEEFLKFWIMRAIDHRFFKSIDDVIQLAMISALGFAFFENIIYFTSQWGKLSGGNFFIFAAVRVTIVAMVHMLCSGILGYYYGMAYFASPMLKIQHMKKKDHPILSFIKRVFRIKRSILYHNEMFVIGLVLSMVIHGLYDFLLSVNPTLLGIPLILPIMFAYFFGGFWYLNSLLQKKDLNLKLGLVGTSVMPKEDFKKLLNQIQEIKEKMAGSIPAPVAVSDSQAAAPLPSSSPSPLP